MTEASNAAPALVIAACLTPPGRGAIAVVGVLITDRATSTMLDDLAEMLFAAPQAGPTRPIPPNRPVLRRLRHRVRAAVAPGQQDLAQPTVAKPISMGPSTTETTATEDVLVVRTSDRTLEIQTHGSPAVVQSLLATLADAGALVVPWTRWLETTAGATAETAATIALADAPTARVAVHLAAQAEGTFRRALDALATLAAVGDLKTVRRGIETLRLRVTFGRRLTEPFRLAILGPPNVGKSRLTNRIVGYARSLVADLPGTTRDVLTAAVAVGGWPVELLDTAGLRAGGDDLERAGMAAGQSAASTADLILWVNDVSEADTVSPPGRFVGQGVPVWSVLNKIDRNDAIRPGRQPDGSSIGERNPNQPHPNAAQPCFALSALTGVGVADLLDALAAHIGQDEPPAGEAIPFLPEQVEGLALVAQALDAPQADPAHVASLLRSFG